MVRTPEAQSTRKAWWAQWYLPRGAHRERLLGTALRLALLAVLLARWLLSPWLPALPFALVWGALAALTLLLWQRLGPSRLPLEGLALWVALGVLGEATAAFLLLSLPGDARPLLFPLLLPLAVRAYTLHGIGQRPLGWLPLYTVPLALLAAWQAEGAAAWHSPASYGWPLLLLLVGALALAAAQQLREAQEQALRLALRLSRRNTDLDVRMQALTQTAENLATRVLELRSLQQGLKAINASLALGTLLEGTVQNVGQLFGGASAVIALRESDGALRLAAQSDGPPLSLVGSDMGSVTALAEQVLHQGVPARATRPADDAPPTTVALAVPMIADGETIGALLAGHQGEHGFSADDQQRLTVFADQAALAVKNSRLYARVEQLYQEVKERSEELEAVLNSIGDAVLVTGPTGELRLLNPVAALILELPEAPPAAQPLPHALLDSGFAEHLRSTLGNASGDPVLGELTIRHGPLRGTRSYQALSAPLRDPEGGPRGLVTVLRDVTASRELEQLKSNFVSTVSHELKTPLHSIKGFLNIVLSEKSTGSLTEVQRDFLSTARDQTNRLERLILDLLEFNRLETGQIKLNPEPLDLSALSERVTEQFRAVSEEAAVALLCLIEEPLPLEGDRLRLEQVLTNLIANAIKFTPPGGQVRLSGQCHQEHIAFAVADSGIGIPAAEQERIFERFYQVDASQSRRYGGTGLGLAICKHIVERHGGRIWVESEEGQGGSTFHVRLPRLLANAAPLTIDFSRLESG